MTVVCAACGFSSRYESFVCSYDGNTPICQNAIACKDRQNVRDGLDMEKKPKRKWWQFV